MSSPGRVTTRTLSARRALNFNYVISLTRGCYIYL